MIAYRLQPKEDLELKVDDYLYDVDEDYTSKKRYIERAKTWTKRVNTRFKTNYKWTDLFPEPTDIGWRYCKRCGEYFWKGEICGCYDR